MGWEKPFGRVRWSSAGEMDALKRAETTLAHVCSAMKTMLCSSRMPLAMVRQQRFEWEHVWVRAVERCERFERGLARLEVILNGPFWEAKGKKRKERKKR